MFCYSLQQVFVYRELYLRVLSLDVKALLMLISNLACRLARDLTTLL